VFHVEHSAPNAIVKIDRPFPESWRRTGLEPSPLETQGLNGFGKITRGRLVGAARWALIAPYMDQAVEKRASGDDERSTAEDVTFLERQPADSAAFEEDSTCPPDDPVNIRLGVEGGPYPSTVLALVGLGPRRPDCRSAAAIQELELYACSVDCLTHQSAKRIDLPDQVTLRRAANRGIARHVRNGVSTESAQPDASPQSRRRPCGFHAGVAAADHDDIEINHQFPMNNYQFNWQLNWSLRIANC
jgi:hypothetical protein